jgi:hypothetical protein
MSPLLNNTVESFTRQLEQFLIPATRSAMQHFLLDMTKIIKIAAV